MTAKVAEVLIERPQIIGSVVLDVANDLVLCPSISQGKGELKLSKVQTGWASWRATEESALAMPKKAAARRVIVKKSMVVIVRREYRGLYEGFCG